MRIPRSLTLTLAFGIALIAAEPCAAQASWTVSARPVMTIGYDDSALEYQFNRISDVRRLESGRILVTMGPDIRYFDAQGKYAAKAGGRGRGPGEFQYIQGLHVLRGDTLLVLNFRDKVWLTGDGKYIRHESMALDGLNANGWFSEGGALLPDGNLLAPMYRQETPNTPRPTGLHRPELRYAVYNIASKTVTQLIVAGGIRQMQEGTQAFSPHAQHAIGADRIYVGDNDTTFVSVFTLDGKPAGKITINEKAIPVTARELDERRRQMLEFAGNDPQRKERAERALSTVPNPKRLPYWGSLMVDRAGNLWVSQPPGATSLPNEWRVFDRSGRHVARATFPTGFQPKDIGSDYVLGVMRDEDGVERIHMYGAGPVIRP